MVKWDTLKWDLEMLQQSRELNTGLEMASSSPTLCISLSKVELNANLLFTNV